MVVTAVAVAVATGGARAARHPALPPDPPLGLFLRVKRNIEVFKEEYFRFRWYGGDVVCYLFQRSVGQV